MKKTVIIFVFLIFSSCAKNSKEIVFLSTSFGNALHGAISLDYDSNHNLLILKRVGSKRVFLPPPPPKVYDYSLQEKDSIKKEEEQYYLNYAKPKTTVYKLTKEESHNLVALIKSIPKQDRKDSYPDFPTGDGFSYNYKIIYSDGNVEDVEVQNNNITSHAKIIFEMLKYAKKYETDKNNIQVLKNFEDWNHPKY